MWGQVYAFLALLVASFLSAFPRRYEVSCLARIQKAAVVTVLRRNLSNQLLFTTLVACGHLYHYYCLLTNGERMRTTDRKSPLSEPFSLYLDLTRFIAALMVVLAHYLQYNIIQGGLTLFIPRALLHKSGSTSVERVGLVA